MMIGEAYSFVVQKQGGHYSKSRPIKKYYFCRSCMIEAVHDDAASFFMALLVVVNGDRCLNKNKKTKKKNQPFFFLVCYGSG